METISEIIPFAKEMLNQRPGRGMLKIYMLGSTLAMLGAVAAVVETVLLPFAEREETDEDMPGELILEKIKREKKQMLALESTLIPTEVVETEVIDAKAKHLGTAGRRVSVNRLHAS
uniref:G0/G1 switch protein 2 n=1 Tax=Semicossyphus pulcher TaxID=241346 RepID=UPI0037E7A2CE